MVTVTSSISNFTHAFLFSDTTMAKDKRVHEVDKSQTKIGSFFGGRPKETTIDSSSDEMSDKDIPPAPAKAKSTPGGSSTTQNIKGIAMDLAPIHEIPAMFSDLVSRMPEMKRVADHLSGRKLRVATMCSGTESPLLALQLICRSLYEEYNAKLEVEHVFSCEIEPFKQAYIERNFRPPLLFRDVCELGQGFAFVVQFLAHNLCFIELLKGRLHMVHWNQYQGTLTF
jgi:hypothetical protein